MTAILPIFLYFSFTFLKSSLHTSRDDYTKQKRRANRKRKEGNTSTWLMVDAMIRIYEEKVSACRKEGTLTGITCTETIYEREVA